MGNGSHLWELCIIFGNWVSWELGLICGSRPYMLELGLICGNWVPWELWEWASFVGIGLICGNWVSFVGIGSN